MPFAGYENFDDCVQQNRDKEDPDAYCGKIKHEVEDFEVRDDSRETCVQKEMLKIGKKHPDWSPSKVRKNAHARCSARGDFVGALSSLFNDFYFMEDRVLVRKAYEVSEIDNEIFEDFCPYELLDSWRGESTFLSDFDASYYNDYDNLPLSIRVIFAVDDALPELEKTYPDKDEEELLKTAYKLAKEQIEVPKNDFLILDFSDFYEELDEEVVSDAAPQFPAAQVLRMQPTPSSMQGLNTFLTPLSKASTGGKDTSTNVDKIGYLNNELLVEFNNGYMYGYDVGPNFYHIMAGAPSKGEFVWNYLRGHEPGHVYGDPSRTTPGGVGGSLVPYRRLHGSSPTGKKIDVNLESLIHQIRGSKQQPAPATGAAETQITPGEEQPTTEKGKGQPAPTEEGKEGAPLPEKPDISASPAARLLQYKKLSEAKMGPAQKARKEVLKEVNRRLQAITESEKKERKKETDPGREQKLGQLEALKEALERAVARGDVRAAKGIRRQMRAIRKNLRRDFKATSDFTHTQRIHTYPRNDFTYSADYIDDMQHFEGPITREGSFEYDDGIRIKDFDNLSQVFSETRHLPVFDSHDENELLGLAYAFEPDKESGYINAKGYSFKNIEDISEINVDESTQFPVSIRYTEDKSDSKDGKQKVNSLIHLAVSTSLTETDRCSTGDGRPCYVQYSDFKKINTKDDSMAKKKDYDDEEGDVPGEQDTGPDEKDEEDEDEKEESDFVKLTKEDYESLKMKADKFETELPELQSQVSDFAKIAEDYRKQQEAALEKEKTELLEGLKEDPRVSDFIETRKISELEDLRLLSDFSSVYKEPEKPKKDNIQSTKDFEERMASFKEQIKKKYYNP